MKKYASFLLALCLLLSLCACQAEDPENLFGTAQPTDASQGQTDIQVPETDPQVPETTPPATVAPDGGKEESYQYGNMQMAIPSGDFMRYDDKVLFSWIVDGDILLYAYDMGDGSVRLLCEDASCAHDGKDCVASNVSGNLELYRGSIYARNYDDQIVELKGDRFEKVVDGSVNCFWHANENLYVLTKDSSLLVYEKGSRTPRVLADEYSQHWNTVFGQYLYSGFGRGICRLDLSQEQPELEVLVDGSFGITDGEYLYYPALQDDRLYRRNMDGGQEELLVDQGVYPGSINFDEEYLYFRLFQGGNVYGEESHALYRMPKANPAGLEQIAELPESIGSVYTVPGSGLLFVCTTDPGEKDAEGYYPNAVWYLYVMNTDGSNLTRLEIPAY